MSKHSVWLRVIAPLINESHPQWLSPRRLREAADHIKRLEEALHKINSYAFEQEEFCPRPMYHIQDIVDEALRGGEE